MHADSLVYKPCKCCYDHESQWTLVNSRDTTYISMSRGAWGGVAIPDILECLTSFLVTMQARN